jgi:hypothetical protein
LMSASGVVGFSTSFNGLGLMKRMTSGCLDEISKTVKRWTSGRTQKVFRKDDGKGCKHAGLPHDVDAAYDIGWRSTTCSLIGHRALLSAIWLRIADPYIYTRGQRCRLMTVAELEYNFGGLWKYKYMKRDP